MPEITRESTLLDVAAIVSAALQRAGIEATLSGDAAVSIYSANEYQSKDLDFVTAAVVDELRPVLEELGFRHTGVPRLSQFSHPRTEWYVEFPPAPIAFGHLHVTHGDCAVIDTGAGQISIITPTQSVMDRLAAVYAWNDQQSWEQAVMVASRQEIEWDVLAAWFIKEGAIEGEFERFRHAAGG